ncbi:Transcription factor IIA alpha/beta subunit [Penicillium malachiteum]|uniref:Transcription factor IIA alpha/beta subunit n=1 Tax=Penicillium malachiteum TaxID=1324776 RepID=UPI0025472803|nr:Transcription factor IIA alpha/beta subunit [Penicillium malachiteum]KAJ5725320.1 Transcription factor IIA alpha/beta subunit [Penicillium malachiteum]
MSNQQVGPVFERVIQEVCDASQVDFEESGVDQKTLLDLRETWQQKLSSVNVAHFPWDPPPPQPAPQVPVLPPQATVPSNAPRPPQHQPQPQHVAPPISLPQSIPQQIPAPAPIQAHAQVAAPMGGPRIKTEPGTNGPPVLPNMNHPMQVPTNPQAARERAISAMQQKYGANAANSVHQLQSQAPGQQAYPQMHPSNGQMPQIKQESNYPPMGHGQTDGGSDDPMADWKAEVARRREAAQNGHGDHLLREHLKSQMLELQAGGLLRPLNEHESPAAAARRAVAETHLNLTQARSNTPRIPGQYDGEEADEDAINSDLDDPDDALADDADADESEGQVMLCTYDKVQRVKNKWKCTLKDGILTSGGKEYVFHKGQGEFEW